MEKIIRIACLVLIVFGIISIFPQVYDWLKSAVEWIFSFYDGKVGIILFIVCLVESIVNN